MSYCHYLRKYLEGLQESELLIYAKEENRHHNQDFLSLKCLTVIEAEIHFFSKEKHTENLQKLFHKATQNQGLWQI